MKQKSGNKKDTFPESQELVLSSEFYEYFYHCSHNGCTNTNKKAHYPAGHPLPAESLQHQRKKNCTSQTYSNTPFTLQAVYPAVVGIGQNIPGLHLSPDVHLRTCNTVALQPIPSVLHRNLKMFKISTSDHHRVSHQHPLSLVSPTTVPLYECLNPSSISMTFCS